MKHSEAISTYVLNPHGPCVSEAYARELAQKLDAANERIVVLEEELESHAFELSPAMVQARNDQLNAELKAIKADVEPMTLKLAQAQDELAVVIKQRDMFSEMQAGIRLRLENVFCLSVVALGILSFVFMWAHSQGTNIVYKEAARHGAGRFVPRKQYPLESMVDGETSFLWNSTNLPQGGVTISRNP